jgi:hypothetical protein
MYKVDLHTHSIFSKDGALKAEDYRRMLRTKQLDCIAITDHNTTDFARQLQEELGPQIIVGEEITTTEGEIIGLYLSETIPARLSIQATVQQIIDQKGLVYIPHPFETVRKGVSEETLQRIIHDVDVIEVHNGRAVFQNRSELAKEWAIRSKKPGAASSDAHGPKGWGRTYSIITALPTHTTLMKLLHAAEYEASSPGLQGLLYPKVNRFKKRFGLDA